MAILYVKRVDKCFNRISVGPASNGLSIFTDDDKRAKDEELVGFT